MPHVIFECQTGERHSVLAREGISLMQAALENDVKGIVGDCGGALACATCHVYIASNWIDKAGPPSDTEAAMLEMAIAPDDRSRLACQILLTATLDGLHVVLPSSQF